LLLSARLVATGLKVFLAMIAFIVTRYKCAVNERILVP
jgi:hypothetical protein